jgi:hypothetical protein
MSPSLQTITNTAHELHRGATLLDAVQRLTQPPQPAYLELGLQVLPQGVSTGILPEGGRVVLELSGGCLTYAPSDGRNISLPIHGRSQSDLFADLFGILAPGELADVLPAGGDLFERVSRGILARGGRYPAPQRQKYLDQAPIALRPMASAVYSQTVQAVFSGIARFLARLDERRTPLVVWPHGFDLSCLVFPGAEIDESRPHLNFGFAPFSDGIEFPYLYAYLYPIPTGFVPAGLPMGARWNTESWTGVLMEYQPIADQPDVSKRVDEICRGIYQVLRPAVSS